MARIPLFLIWCVCLVWIGCGEAPVNDVGSLGGKILFGRPPVSPRDDAVVSLHERGPFGWHGRAFCSGTLIRPDVVLTAAHCIDRSRSVIGRGRPYTPDKLVVHFGDGLGDGIDERDVRVAEILSHEGYTGALFAANDMALLRLSEPVTDIKPIPELPEELAVGTDDLGNFDVHLTGFGRRENGDTGDKRTTTVTPDQYTGFWISWDQGETGHCYGDSGGPAFIEIDGNFYVIGVTNTVTNGDGELEWCDGRGRDTVVTPFLEWITGFAGPSAATDGGGGNGGTGGMGGAGIGGMDLLRQPELSGAEGESLAFAVEIAEGDVVTFGLSAGEGDADLYVRAGEAPERDAYDCRSHGYGEERCDFEAPAPGTYHIMVFGYSAFSGVELFVVAR